MVNGILLLYHHCLGANAKTITDYVEAFPRHSEFAVWPVNTELGFPPFLEKNRFRIVLLHYSLFGSHTYMLSGPYYRFLADSAGSYKIAIFQDEYYYCKQRFEFLNNYGIDCIYTLLEPQYYKDVYQKYTGVPKIVTTIPGFVSDELCALAETLPLPDEQRQIDIGYRGRRLPYWMGKAPQEKHLIGTEFRKRARGRGLKLDIESAEDKRIYGRAWYEFLANCRAVLGVEAGVDLFDVNDQCRAACEELMRDNPSISFETLWKKVLHKYEGNIPHRVVSPRHFEAAAMRACQILFIGRYSGALEPMVHYIPLEKDFSNFDDVIGMYRDPSLRRQLTEGAFRDLIASGEYSYRQFVGQFDRELKAEGFDPACQPSERSEVNLRLYSDWLHEFQRSRRSLEVEIEGLTQKARRLRSRFTGAASIEQFSTVLGTHVSPGSRGAILLHALRHGSYPGKSMVRFFGRPLLRVCRRMARRRHVSEDAPRQERESRCASL